MVIGQEKLVTMFDTMIENNTLPKFILLTGIQGIGKKTMAKYIADKLNAHLYKPEDNKVNVGYVREITEQAYKQTDTVLFLMPDVDYLNKSAANALLKITEEPPINAYFIMTCSDGRSIPSTLRSRCTEYRLLPCSIDDLKRFATTLGIDVDEHADLFKIYRTPGDFINFVEGKVKYKEIEEFTEKVINNIGTVSGANVFKIDERIAFKPDDEGYSLNTFWTIFSNSCMQRAKDLKNSKRNMYFSYVRITSQYRDKLTIVGINRKSLFDLWLIEIRDIYDKYN